MGVRMVSDYERERAELGGKLRELRHDAQLTGKQLAESQGWHPSKVSKTESGKQTPTQADVRAWATACRRPDLAPGLVASLHALEERYIEFRRLFHAGKRPVQQALAELEAATSATLNFENAVIPGLLQTPEYARAMLGQRPEDVIIIEDLAEAVAARMQRQQVLYRTGKHFHFVITEAALRYRVSTPRVMAGQLDRLMVLSTLPATRFGVIPFGVRLPVHPLHSFVIYDDRAVHVENFTAAINLTDPAEVATYQKIFEQLAAIAHYGADARALVALALSDVAAAME
jgi:transcriptional regulator with XRE-family HTH domain